MMRVMLYEAAQVMLDPHQQVVMAQGFWAMKIARHRGMKSNRRRGATTGGNHAPHVGGWHRVPLDPRRRSGMEG